MSSTISTASGLEQYIRELNDPRNQAAPDKIDFIQRQIQRIQREPSAWQAGLALLEHPEPQMRFFGSLTLTIKINADWNVDHVGSDRDLVSTLLERLVQNFVKLAAIPDALYVLQKLSSTLVAVFLKGDSAWALPIRHVLACTISGRYVTQEDVPDMSVLLGVPTAAVSLLQLKSLLMLSLTLAEEIGGSTSTVTSHSTEVRFANNADDVWQLLRFCVTKINQQWARPAGNHTHQLAVGMEEQHANDVAKAVIMSIPHWTRFVKTGKGKDGTNTLPMDCFQTCVEALCTFSTQPNLSIDTLQTLTTLEQNHHRLLIQTMPTYATNLIGSEQAMKWISQLLQGDFDVEPTAYVEFLEVVMNQADVTTSAYLTNESYTKALSQLSQLLRSDGIAGIDDSVCSIALEVLTSVVEGFNDWDDTSIYGGEVRSLIATACYDSIVKMQMPELELTPETQLWDADDRAKFQDFRYDAQDFLQNAFTVIGSPLIQEIVQHIIDSNTSHGWTQFEANLCALVAFADTVNGDPEQFDNYLEVVYTSPRWISASIPSNTPERVRKVMIKLVGETTGFFERHPQNLLASLNFLFESLRITSSATSASRAIFTLCDTQRAILVEALPQFISSLSTISDLDPNSRSRIFGGVSAIIQALPDEGAKLDPLSQLLDLIESETAMLLGMSILEDELRLRATDAIWTLATIGKGLRAPSDGPVGIEASTHSQREFWTDGVGGSVQSRVLTMLDALHHKINGECDSLFIEATCDLLKSAFTEDHPSPFKFPTTVVLDLLRQHITLMTPQPDIILGTSTGFLASVQPATLGSGFTDLLSAVLMPCQEALGLASEASSLAHADFAAAALDFFGRCLPKWSKHWLSLPDADQSAAIIIRLALKLLEGADEPLPRRAAASFFTSLFEASRNASDQMDGILRIWVPPTIAAILHLLGGECARSELDSLGEPLKKLVQRQPLLANKLIKEAVKQSDGVLSPGALQATKPEQRARFAAQIEMLRGGRQTMEIIREFWVACRGSSFGYVV